jgi:hypothetical protein
MGKKETFKNRGERERKGLRGEEGVSLAFQIWIWEQHPQTHF